MVLKLYNIDYKSIITLAYISPVTHEVGSNYVVSLTFQRLTRKLYSLGHSIFYSLPNNMFSNICITWPAPSSYLIFQIKFQRNMPCLQYLKLQPPFTTFLIIHCLIFIHVSFYIGVLYQNLNFKDTDYSIHCL